MTIARLPGPPRWAVPMSADADGSWLAGLDVIAGVQGSSPEKRMDPGRPRRTAMSSCRESASCRPVSTAATMRRVDPKGKPHAARASALTGDQGSSAWFGSTSPAIAPNAGPDRDQGCRSVLPGFALPNGDLQEIVTGSRGT